MSEESLTSVEEPIIQLTENGAEGFEVLCRLCANRSDHLIPIYSEEGVSNDLADKMNMYLPVKISRIDVLPLQCCFQCATTVLTWHELVVASVEADRRLREVQAEVEKQIVEQEEPGPSQTETVDDDRLKSTNEDKLPAKEKEVYDYLNVELISEEEYNQQISCKYCTRNFHRKCDLFRHSKQCSMNTNISQNTDKHFRVRRKKTDIIAEYFCNICSRGFTRKFDMLKHRNNQHQIALQTQQNRLSDTETNCEQESNNLKIDYIPRNKNVELLNRCKIRNEEGKEYYKCEICSKLIHLSYNFLRHQTIHTGVRPYCCHICGKSYRTSSILNRHINELHNKVRKFACDTCEKKFPSKATLEDHKNIHTNRRPFCCDLCGKSFKQKSCLYIHKKFHSNEFRFSCKICGKKFRRASDLKVHNWIHTGHRPYACTVCGSMFRLSQDLKRHSRIHGKLETDYMCDDCGASFKHPRSLKVHQKAHSQEDIKPEQEVDVD